MSVSRKGVLTASAILATLIFASCHKHPPVVKAPAAAPTVPPTVTLTAQPSTVQQGQSVTLSWSSENATSLDLEPAVGKVQANGSTAVTADQSTTYTLTATGPGGSRTASARVTVTVPPPAASSTTSTSPSVSESTLESEFQVGVKDAFFDTNSSTIRADAQSALTQDARFFNAHPNINFTIEGHCDERGSEEYNLGLGDRRANAAKQYLVALGVSADRITTISYGKDRPFCTEHTEECWQLNRRAHFVLGSER